MSMWALPTCGVAQSLVPYKHQRTQIHHMSPYMYVWCGSISAIMPALEGLDWPRHHVCYKVCAWGYLGVTSQWSSVDLDG